jgi:flagellar hook-length control protein FliK
MSAPFSLIRPTVTPSPGHGPGNVADAASAAAPIVGDGGADQPFALVLDRIVKTVGLSGGTKPPDAQTNAAAMKVGAFQVAQDPATIAGAAVVAAMTAGLPGIPAINIDGARDKATAALPAAATQPAEIDLAALLAQLSPVSRRAAMDGRIASHVNAHGDKAADTAGTGTDTGAATSSDASASNPVVVAAQVVGVPMTAPIITPSHTERSPAPKADRTTPNLLSTSSEPTSTTNVSQLAVPITQTAQANGNAEPKIVTAGDPKNPLTADLSANAAATIAAPASTRAALAAQPAANADHGTAFETILAHTQGDNAAAIATAQASAAAEATNKVAAAMQNAAPALVVSTPVGNAGWAAEVSDKLVWMVGRQEQRVELVLNPPQLGRVEVSLSLNGDQATAQFLSANPVVREALESAMPRLREMLADGGITLGQTHVGSDSSGQAANQRENGDNRSGFGSNNTISDTTIRAGSAPTPWFGRGHGLVDVFA